MPSSPRLGIRPATEGSGCVSIMIPLPLYYCFLKVWFALFHYSHACRLRRRFLVLWVGVSGDFSPMILLPDAFWFSCWNFPCSDRILPFLLCNLCKYWSCTFKYIIVYAFAILRCKLKNLNQADSPVIVVLSCVIKCSLQRFSLYRKRPYSVGSCM